MDLGLWSTLGGGGAEGGSGGKETGKPHALEQKQIKTKHRPLILLPGGAFCRSLLSLWKSKKFPAPESLSSWLRHLFPDLGVAGGARLGELFLTLPGVSGAIEDVDGDMELGEGAFLGLTVKYSPVPAICIYMPLSFLECLLCAKLWAFLA